MKLDYNILLDKTYGTFVGKTIAGVLGASFEAHKCSGDFNDADKLWPDTLYPNDDLDIQLCFLDMMLETGPKVTYEKIAKYWRERCWYNFCEYGSFLNNEQRGIHAPLSGRLNNSYWCEDQGCPIRAEVFGVTAPCNIELAAEHARIDGSSDHIGESVNAEMFWAACTSYAYVCDNLNEIFDKALEVINPESDIYAIALEVREIM
ncbi:MAG: ADP-ribosylglycohydrolase family protein, partial [Armatimonadetes bacterium]|nr:ADP-ribosylglycohydrolase family protein [Candidatus Hippobium faecium]